MSKMSATPPYMLGFDQLERLAARAARTDGYPPFNIEQRGADAFRVTLAVAGFAEADLSVTVEGRQLVMRGRQAEGEEAREYLHRGIAARAFQRSFVLADGVEIEGAHLENGLLHVDLSRASESEVVQTIPISRK